MPASLIVTTTDALSHARTLVLVGRRKRLEHKDTIALLPKGVSPKVWSSMLKRCEPGDAGRASATWNKDGTGQVIACVLPEHCSRHNAPSRAWAIPGLLRSNANHGNVDVVLCVDNREHGFAAACAAARAFPLWTGKSKPVQRTVHLAVHSARGKVDITQIQIAVDGVRRAAALVDQPTSVLGPDAFVQAARDVAEAHPSVSLTVIRGQTLLDHGLGGIWGVGKAAAQSPALVVLDYPGKGGSPQAWVGKGIVYDTGGLSIKSKTGMPGMKADMGGAAAVLAAFEAAVRMGTRAPLCAVLCIAENAVGPSATRPDDILHMYSGKTVEVNNTDAEGRLVLADGVAWVAQHRKPHRIIDLATLTGAQSVSTGKLMAALFCNDDALEDLAVRTGRSVGELCHPLPYVPEFHRKEFASQVADMKNSVKDRGNAQSSCAGQFIGNHLMATDYDGPWLHVDLAGPSTQNGRGTGFGVGLLLGLLSAKA